MISIGTLGVAYAVLDLWAGQPPRLRDYFEIIMSHVGPNGTVGWYMAVAPSYFYWIPVGLVICLPLFSAAFKLTSTRANGLGEVVRPLLPCVPIAALAALELTYWLGRSHWTNLVVSIVPAAALSVIIAQTAISNSHGATRVLAVMVVAFYFAVAAGSALAATIMFTSSKALAPTLTATLRLSSGQGAGIGEDLRNWRLLTNDARKNLQDIEEGRIKSFLPVQGSLRLEEFVEVSKAVERYAPNRPKILLFFGMGRTTGLLMLLGRTHALPISCIDCDGLSESQRKYIAAHVGQLEEGQPVFLDSKMAPVVSGKITNIHGYRGGDETLYVLTQINALWDLAPVERGPTVSVYRLRKPGIASKRSGTD